MGFERDAQGAVAFDAETVAFINHNLLSEQPVVLSGLSASHDAPLPAALQAQGLVSAASVPILSDEEPVGVLFIASRGARMFTLHDVFFLRVVAHVLATAMERHANEEHSASLNANLKEAVEQLRVDAYDRQIALVSLREAAGALTLANQQAELARAEAEAANQAKSDFLSRMSHELRTPLNAILGFGQVLEMREENRWQIEDVEHILRAGRHLLDLINEVLDISRIEAGRMSLALEPVSVAATVRESLQLVQPMATGRGIVLRDDVSSAAGDRIVALADQQRLKQVLINLLSNAVKYNRENGSVIVALEVSDNTACLHEGVVCSGTLRILVRDSGPGLSLDEQGRIFVPFERLQAERTGIEGTGIGLSLCRRLAEAMHGHIGVESAPGEGSTFWVSLPMLAQTALPLEYDPAALETEPRPSTSVALTILCIEDNPANLKLIESALGEFNLPATLLSAKQGQLGLDLARQHRPDLILLDVHLPDIQGDEVLQCLQADDTTRHIPVVVLSADAAPRLRERLLAGGAQAYLTKPLDLRHLFRVVQDALAGATSAL